MAMLDVTLANLIHVTGAVLWVGGGALHVMFVAPTAGRTGPEALPFMRNLLTGTSISDYLSGLGLATVLSGLYLYWRLGYHTLAFDSAGMVLLSVGALAGLVAVLVGILGMRPLLKELGGIFEAIGETGPSEDQQQRMQAIQGTLRTHGMVFLTLSLVALVGMGLFRYV